jgi:RNA polymerase sigma factor (sigma-70 family)
MSINASVPIEELVAGARRDDANAWNALVRRFLPLVLAITRTYRLSERDAEDVSQVVWLRLTQHLSRIRDPRAVPKWISTTARHECQRVIRHMRMTVPMDPLTGGPLTGGPFSGGPFPGVPFSGRPLNAPSEAETDAGLLRAEQRQALRDGLAELPAAQQRMLLLLTADPPVSYRDISHLLGIPVGSIGPTRARCLQRLRGTSAMRQFLDSSACSAQV